MVYTIIHDTHSYTATYRHQQASLSPWSRWPSKFSCLRPVPPSGWKSSASAPRALDGLASMWIRLDRGEGRDQNTPSGSEYEVYI